MADLSKITLPSGSTYNLKDTVAREMAAGTIHLVEGQCTTALTDMATTNPIVISGEDYTAVKGDAVLYNNKEFVFDGTYWHEFGDITGLGDLAFKNSATGSFTPAGTVSQPTFTGETSQIDIDVTPSGTVSQPTFTGNAMNSTGTFTPEGTVSKPNVSVTPSTTSVNSITDVGTLPVLTTTVANETLTIGFSQGTLPTKGAAQTVMTGATAALDAAPTFTGTQGNVQVSGTPTGTVSQPTFTGTEATFQADVTPRGTISQPTFTGATGTVTVE